MITSIYPQPQSSIKKISETGGVRFPEDIQIILRADRPHIGNLFLSNLEAAQNPQILQNLQIGAAVSAAKKHNLKHPKHILKKTKYVPLEDDTYCDLYDFLDETVTFIADNLKQTNVLVHCVAGVSRSAALVIAFMMRERRLSLEDAYTEVKSRRRIICPSENILEQLREYEQELALKSSKILSKHSQRNPTITDQSSLSFKTQTVCDDLRSHRKSQTSKLITQDFGEAKSHRSKRSSINIAIKAPKEQIRNPEESFVSFKSKGKSLNNKSFASSRSRTERLKSQQPLTDRQHSQFQADFIDETSTPTLSKLSEGRKDFSKKMTRVNSLNDKIIEQFEVVQERYETDTRNHKQVLDNELSEIYKVKANLYAQESERKSRMKGKRSVHKSTMEDQDVKNYILSSLPDHRP